jgi:hypothetical protein
MFIWYEFSLFNRPGSAAKPRPVASTAVELLPAGKKEAER